MAIVIQEVTHEVVEAGAEARGVGGVENTPGGQSSESVKDTHVLAAIRRETSRLARLWAD